MVNQFDTNFNNDSVWHTLGQYSQKVVYISIKNALS